MIHQFVDAITGQRNGFCRHRATRRRMGRESPDDVVNLISFRAGFLARPTSVGIRFGRALLRQIFRRRNSLRMNRPESVPRHPFSEDLSSNELQTRALLTASVVSTACETSSVLPAPVRHTNGTSLSIDVQSVLPTAASFSKSNCPSPERSRAF